MVTVTQDARGSDWEAWYLLRTDAHHDNPKCDQDLEKYHLDLALERGAGIIDNGDLFCAMQGRWDKRADKGALRPEHQNGRYLDRLVDTAADFYEPYAHLWVAMGTGNHETAIRKRHETDLTERLCERLRDRTGALVPRNGYTGWVRFWFNRTATRRRSVTLWRHHGYAGGGQVTKDRIQAQRQQVYAEADIMFSGHTHDAWSDDSTVRIGLTPAGEVRRTSVLYIKGPSYKDAYVGGSGMSWEEETGKPPKPLGAYWLHFFIGRGGDVCWEAIRAQ